jgi:hypothetical protein
MTWDQLTEEERYARWSAYCQYTSAAKPLSYFEWYDLMEGSIWE